MNNESVGFKKQSEFPYLLDFKAKFPVDENSIFVYRNHIYTDLHEDDIPYDVVYHEIKHLKQQKEIGADNWIKQYLNDEDFRLEQEKEAYIYQLRKVKEIGDRNELFNITDGCANNLSSKLYGGMMTKKQALDYFRDNI